MKKNDTEDFSTFYRSWDFVILLIFDYIYIRQSSMSSIWTFGYTFTRWCTVVLVSFHTFTRWCTIVLVSFHTFTRWYTIVHHLVKV